MYTYIYIWGPQEHGNVRILQTTLSGILPVSLEGLRTRRKDPYVYPRGSKYPKAIKGMVFGTRVLNYWVLGPSGYGVFQALVVGFYTLGVVLLILGIHSVFCGSWWGEGPSTQYC